MTRVRGASTLVVAACLVVGLAARGGGAQAPPREDDRPVVVIGTTLIQVDAIVTDKDGRPVTDLRRDDFDVFQDDRPEEISAFAYVSTPSVPRTGVPEAPSLPTHLRSAPVRRSVAIVVDDLKSNESARTARDAIRRFVDDRMEPGDLVAIVQARAGAGALQQFSADPQVLHAAIDRIRFVPRSRPASDCDDDAAERGQQDLDEALRTDVFVRGTLGVLNFVIRGLKGLPGRKSVVLLSDGMPCALDDTDPRGTGRGRVRAAVLGLVDLANRASVSVYSVDVRGLETLSANENDPPRRRSLVDLAQETASERSQLFRSRDVMSFLADQTGGLFFRNNNDISESLRRAIDDQRGYYLLAYEADKATFESKPGGRDFHKLTVKVKREGLTVRSRSGFYGYSEEEPQPETRSAAQQMVDAVISPFAATDIGMQLTPLFADDPRAGPILRCLLHVDAADLTFSEERDGSEKAIIEVAVVAFGDNGGMVSRQVDRHELRIRKESYRLALERGLTQLVVFPIRRPGAYQLRAAVRDAASGRIGSDYRFVQLPDVAGGDFAISSVLVSSDDIPMDQRSLDKRSDASASAPVSPAVRRFNPGDRLTYGFEIYNARRDRQTKRVTLESFFRLYREGKLVHTSESVPLDASAQGDLTRLRFGRGLQLGSEMEAGSYVLEIVVTDLTGKRRTVSGWVDFEVRAGDRSASEGERPKP